ncbi:MAG TPA: LPXTG cell wall anchor domain-containing protein [Myxococcota bacterium]|nr:LPXTG cell wall anchor domain-containing protein [Myxococcota bacterium]
MSSRRPTLTARPLFAWLWLIAALLALPACDLLPQTAGEWTVALVIAGVLVVGVGVMAWVTSRQSKK